MPQAAAFQQTVYSFKNFHAAIEEYEKYASGYALKCRIPLTGFNVALNGTFILLIPAACMILSGLSGQAAYQDVLLDFLFYSLFTPVCTTMMSRVMFAGEQLMAAKSAVKRIEGILNEQPLPEPEPPRQPKDASVSFEDVCFSYPGAAEKALDHVSFEIPEGKTVALVGPSGGGKSTSANLAAGFYDVDSGRITLGGTDIAPIDSVALMKDFSVVFQNVVLFNNTVMENIRVGRKNASDEDVIAAAQAAHCHEFIEKLPDGYQTVIGENGSTLSGGECQRLSIARALLKDAPVILLDEATASLDVDNETEIQEAITRLIKGKTVLIIAHRMRTVENADRIVVLDGGVVAESGTHEKLMQANGLYRKMADLQTAAAGWKLRA